MLVGNVTSIGIGGILVVVLTFLTTEPLNVDQIGEVWEKTRDIDSPLMPWTEIYAKYTNQQTNLLNKPFIKHRSFKIKEKSTSEQRLSSK